MKYKKLLFSLLSLLAMLAMIANPAEIIFSAKNALILCASSLIPSVFPFIAAASVFINYSEKSSFKIFAPILNFLFGTSPASCAALLPGMICGYPVGASCTCELYKNNLISKSEAESLIAFSNNSGPLFIIGTLGVGLLGCAKHGVMLYAIHIFSAIICGITLKPFTKSEKNAMKINLKTSSKNFTDCISDSTLTILKICGFVIVFAVINSLLSPVVSLMPKYLRCLFTSFLELTNASAEITKLIENEKMCLVFLSGALGWSGMSVHMQVKNIVGDLNLSMKKYYIIRLLSCIISMIVSYFVFDTGNMSEFSLNASKDDILLFVFLIIAISFAAKNISSKFLLKLKKG